MWIKFVFFAKFSIQKKSQKRIREVIINHFVELFDKPTLKQLLHIFFVQTSFNNRFESNDSYPNHPSGNKIESFHKNYQFVH